jgi:hypothetical protein
MKTLLEEWRYRSTHSLTSALDGGEWSASRPGRFTPRVRALGTHWIGGWVGPRAVLDAVVKRKIPSPRRESNPRTPIVQPVAQRYTDWVTTAPSNEVKYIFQAIAIVLLYTVKKSNLTEFENFRRCIITRHFTIKHYMVFQPTLHQKLAPPPCL